MRRISALIVAMIFTVCRPAAGEVTEVSLAAPEAETRAKTVNCPAAKAGIGAVRVYPARPAREQILEDSKGAKLSIIDALILKKDSIRMGSAGMDVLVSRATADVEYVWSPPYRRYVRPRFVLPNAQKLYDRAR